MQPVAVGSLGPGFRRVTELDERDNRDNVGLPGLRRPIICRSMQLTFHTLDVFTNRRFGGNPLAVVLDADALSTEQMQTITREFNLSETIFVMKPEDPANTAKVRIFFPGGEMPFAGHPTVGCAVLLAEMKYKAGCSFETEIRLEEKAGLVPVKVSRIGDHPRAQFTAPVVPFAVDIPLPALISWRRRLSLEPGDIGFENHGIGVHQGGPRFFHVPVKSREALARCVVAEPHWSADDHGPWRRQCLCLYAGRRQPRRHISAPACLRPRAAFRRIRPRVRPRRFLRPSF